MDTKNIEDLFKKITGYHPYDYQLRSWRSIKKIMSHGGKVVIEIPTAGGKTEAAIFPFLHQFISNKWDVTRLIYVLPTRSLVEKQRERINKYIDKILKIKRISHDEAEKLSRKIVQIEYGLEQTHAFLGFIVLTTWDTFLYGLAAHRTIGNRFTFPTGAIAQSLIVFDEVQMYQDERFYIPRLIGLVVQKLEEARVPLVFMTATLSTKLKELFSINKTEIISIEKSDHNRPERGEVTVEFRKEINDNELFDLIKKNINANKKVLIIKNTVKSAIKVYNKVKSFGKSMLLHSRFSVEDREKKESMLDHMDIIVSTQVVEAGLDLPNVGLVITDLAPLDALIQRIGRCARRKGEKGRAIIILPEIDTELETKLRKNIVLGLNSIMKNYQYEVTINENDKIIEIVILSPNKNKKIFILYGNKKTYTKNKEDHYIMPYPSFPYNPLILLKTFDKINNISTCLYDINVTREAIDDVYKEYYENNLVLRDLFSAYIYFKELKLFSLPPEYELKSRLQLYSMLLPIENEELVSHEWKDLTKKIIRVDYKWLSNIWKELKEVYELNLSTKEPFSTGKPPEPYKVYIIPKKYYDPEFGIIIDSFTNGEIDE